MFCPECGNPFILKHNEHGRDELYCVKGEMGLSQVMWQTFEERYGQHPILHFTNNFMEVSICFALATAKHSIHN